MACVSARVVAVGAHGVHSPIYVVVYHHRSHLPQTRVLRRVTRCAGTEFLLGHTHVRNVHHIRSHIHRTGTSDALACTVVRKTCMCVGVCHCIARVLRDRHRVVTQPCHMV